VQGVQHKVVSEKGEEKAGEDDEDLRLLRAVRQCVPSPIMETSALREFVTIAHSTTTLKGARVHAKGL
jgi:hypothetical protein